VAKGARSFSQPEAAKAIRPLPARLFLLGGVLAASACVAFFNASALWPAPLADLSTVALAVLIAIAGAFGTFETVDGLAEYASLAMPIAFASLLVLDWRHYVVCGALGEFLQFISERARGTNPTMWYVRCFNVCMVVTAGFGAELVLRVLWSAAQTLPAAWASPALAFALICATLTWQVLDEAQTWILVTLAADLPLSTIRFSTRRSTARLALLLVSIPFAFIWGKNPWIALLALTPLGKGLGLLGVSELEHRGRTDARTGLFNAGRFDELLQSTLIEARGDGSSFALLIADIDHFKSVNDAHGHPAGDIVIRQFGAVLSAMARTSDVAARIGGEEFAMILPRSDLDGALSFAERVRHRVADEPFEAGLDGVPLSITASVGVALFPVHAETASALYACADAALYTAKRSGRNRVCCAD
jgi:diguanylate cyclase (GGDEF)-like protein